MNGSIFGIGQVVFLEIVIKNAAVINHSNFGVAATHGANSYGGNHK
jgi:hypothetical protein